MVRFVLRCFGLLLAVAAGCAHPPFPLNQPERPAEVAPAAWSGVWLFADGRRLCSAVRLDATTALTARHCIAPDFEGAVLVRPDANGSAVVGVVVATDADVAILQLRGGVAAHDVATAEPMPGMTGMVLGYGCSVGRRLDARPARFLGRVLAPDPTNAVVDVWAAVACHGDSGGGVFDAVGRLVGVSSAISVAADGTPLLFTVPAAPVGAFLRAAP